MAYGYPYTFNTYPQYPTQPVPDQLGQLRQTAAPQSGQGITWVQGEAGARGYLVGAGNSVMLMDSDANVFYIKSTDSAGIPQPLRVFDYKERIQPQNRASQTVESLSDNFITRKEFEALKAQFDALQQTGGVKDESVVQSAKRRQTADE